MSNPGLPPKVQRAYLRQSKEATPAKVVIENASSVHSSPNRRENTKIELSLEEQIEKHHQEITDSIQSKVRQFYDKLGKTRFKEKVIDGSLQEIIR